VSLGAPLQFFLSVPLLLAKASPETTPEKNQKRAWLRSHIPVNCLALNANSSKMAKYTNFKFGKLAASQSPRHEKNFKRGRG